MSWQDIVKQLYVNNPMDNDEQKLLFKNLDDTLVSDWNDTAKYPNDDDPIDRMHYAVRTCNSYWDSQSTISRTNIDPFFLGMASQAAEREDNIITPDLRGQVYGPFHYSRRDLMAINIQRGRDHGLPDYNSARIAYGLDPVRNFEDINALYGADETVTENIENLRAVYNNDISKCDIWACGLAETIPSNDTNEEMSGPGELFTEILFDQFMRIRHGDRFWYENYEQNG